DRGLEPHLAELVDGPRGQAVAAGLVAGEDLALEHADVVAGLRQPEPGGAARRPTPDDEHVVAVVGHGYLGGGAGGRGRAAGAVVPTGDKSSGRSLGPSDRGASAAQVGLGDAVLLRQLPEPGLGEGHLAVGDGEEVGVVGVLLGDVLAGEHALVEHDLGELLLVELVPEGRHATLLRRLVGAVGAGRPAVRAEHHPRQVVAVVGPGGDDRAVDERRAAAALAGATVAGGAVRAVHLRAEREGVGVLLGGWLERAHVHVPPHRQRGERGHGPVGDALAALRGLDVDGIGRGGLGRGRPSWGGGGRGGRGRRGGRRRRRR